MHRIFRKIKRDILIIKSKVISYLCLPLSKLSFVSYFCVEKEIEKLLQYIHTLDLSEDLAIYEPYILYKAGWQRGILLMNIFTYNKHYKRYNGQLGQDFLVDTLLREKQNGFFVDVGASEPKKISNTYFFEKERNWSGILIEPLPDAYQRLVEQRNVPCVNCCASGKKGTQEFILNKSDPALSVLKKDLVEEHKKRLGETEIISVRTIPLTKILNNQNAPKEIDYCSIDVEGAEKDVLDSLDFTAFKVKIFSVEENDYNPHSKNGIAEKMASEGYIPVKIFFDVLYISKDFIVSLQQK